MEQKQGAEVTKLSDLLGARAGASGAVAFQWSCSRSNADKG